MVSPFVHSFIHSLFGSFVQLFFIHLSLFITPKVQLVSGTYFLKQYLEVFHRQLFLFYA